jgi:CelD/BcsL family acetyltransferase involved in cellulose biosynthesis
VQITFIHDDSGFEELSSEWNNLLNRAITDVPFLRYEYLSTWWSTLGGGEWQDGKLWIGVGRNDRGELIGLAPLFRSQIAEGKYSLMFLGSFEISDYLDLIVPNDAVEDFTDALLTSLEKASHKDWELLDLYNIPDDSPSLPVLENGAQRRGWEVTQERIAPCPVITLDDTWEEYVAGLAKKQRHELRRKLRRAAKHPSGVTWQLIGPEEDIEAPMENFMRLMATDPKKIDFLTPEMHVQFLQSMRAAHKNGWLHLSFLKVGSEYAAGYLSFDYGGRLWVYNSGLDPAYLSISPGWILLSHMIQWSIENDRKEFDFLRGDEKYKYLFGGIDRYIIRMTITR